MLKGAIESEASKILRTLGNKDSIKILRFAKNGFDAAIDTHKKLGLSIKRYYYRLERLMDAGLLIKKNDGYELTPLGTIVCDSLERRIFWAIQNIDKLRIVETLKTSKTIDDGTLKHVASVILGTDLGGLGIGMDLMVIKTYEELVETTYSLIQNCKDTLYLASRYTDARCVEAGWRALSRGVEMWIIDGDVALLNGRMKMLRMVISHPTSIRAFYELMHSNTSHIRHRELPFSFMVVDNKVACFEVLNPVIEGFFAAIRLESKEVCDRLVRTFQDLWERAAEDPLKDLSGDLMNGLRK